ncbi:MAG: EF-P lysine aminoacylase GenX [Proteobacteria bacterium]|nr:EF-P lysine aminoacylase GenX [Pseudomonadota bacterium]
MIHENGLRKRAALIQTIRRFFVDRDYIEVDTPVRLPVLIPEAYNEPVESGNCYLQTSPEICMKRILAETGCQKIFQLCPCFRKNERGDHHLPEFTMLEWYRSHCDYHALMDECEELVKYLAQADGQRQRLTFQDKDIDLTKPWMRLSVEEAFRRYAPVTLAAALADNSFDEILCKNIEPELGLEIPVFLYDYPISLGALARKNKENPSVAERFELYIGSIELANGFSELTDQAEQRQRFENELQLIEKQGRPSTGLPEKFLSSLPQMEETAGIALGLDRLAMVLWNKPTIDEVVSFVPEDL